MPTIGVIAEGVTDQQVLERIVTALCATDAKPAVNFLQPASPQEPGNWDRVFKYVASERFRGAFQTNDFVVVHIDTDVCDRFTPPILRTNAEGEIPAETLIEEVKLRLVEAMDGNAPGYYELRKTQVIFAIAVHSLECWIIPLYSNRENEWKRHANCLNLLNHQLKTLGFSIDENNKGGGYALLMRNEKIRKMKRKTVLEISRHNPGFADFVAQVEALINRDMPSEADAS